MRLPLCMLGAASFTYGFTWSVFTTMNWTWFHGTLLVILFAACFTLAILGVTSESKEQ